MDLQNLPGIKGLSENLTENLAEELDKEITKLARDGRISEIFYYFEALTTLKSGRTVGRKIGVVQEIVLKKYLEQSDAIKRRMFLEQRLRGISGAAHKVEFSWYAIAALQCGIGQVVGDTELKIKAINPSAATVRLEMPGGKSQSISLSSPELRSGALRQHLNARQKDLRLRAVRGERVEIDVVDKNNLLASLESKRVGAQRFSGSDKLGSGIQTIEKAKQASLVAIDLDLAYNHSVKPLQSNLEKQLLSFVALGNGVHWTEKDKAVLETFVDYTFLVPDKAIIRYAEYVSALAPKDSDAMKHFMDYFQGMTNQVPDDFEVFDDDFTIMRPSADTRTLKVILEEHLARVNPI